MIEETNYSSEEGENGSSCEENEPDSQSQSLIIKMKEQSNSRFSLRSRKTSLGHDQVGRNKPSHSSESDSGSEESDSDDSSSESDSGDDLKKVKWHKTNIVLGDDEISSESEEEDEKVTENFLSFSVKDGEGSKDKPKTKSIKRPPCSLQPSEKTDIYISTAVPKSKHFISQKVKHLDPKSKEKEVMKKSVMTSDFEKKDSIKAYEEGLRQGKLQRRKEREKSKGKKWYDLPATELTEEKKNDLSVLQMRRVLDPKRFYKNNDMKGLPKYFQMGKVVETAADFYHARIPKKQRKETMVEELLADAEFRKFNKRKYTEIQEKTAKSRGAFRHAKRLKNKKR